MSVFRAIDCGPEEGMYRYLVERREGFWPFSQWFPVKGFDDLDEAEAYASLHSELDALYPREQSRWKAGKRL
jgi:hypothetical protein